MKLSVSLSAILAILPALALAASPLDGRSNGDMYFPRYHARNFGRQRQGGFGQQGAGNRFGQGQGQQAAVGGKNKSKSSTSVAAPPTSAAAVVSTTAAAATTQAATSAKDKHRGGNNGAQSTTAAAAASTDAASTTDAASSTDTATGTSSAAAATTSDVTGSVADNNGGNDSSLTLPPDLVATGLEQDGQETPTAGQVASLTSKNNFINYCAGKTITNGQQITTGSCDPIPMGDIVPKANMPRSKFKNPTNFSTIPANTNFTIEMVLNNLQAGVFTNAQKTYYMAPQQLNGQGILIGHTHVVIQPMGDFGDGAILDPATFTFFKGINTGQDGQGVVTAAVAGGVPPGNYRLASINTDSNHAPAVVAVAQHGCLDDMIYFTAQ